MDFFKRESPRERYPTWAQQDARRMPGPRPGAGGKTREIQAAPKVAGGSFASAKRAALDADRDDRNVCRAEVLEAPEAENRTAQVFTAPVVVVVNAPEIEVPVGNEPPVISAESAVHVRTRTALVLFATFAA
jgi:hypothetical protein